MMSTQANLMPYTVDELLDGLVSGVVAEGVTVSGICSDSRQVDVGDLFLALADSVEASKKHVREAILRGAGAVVVSERLAGSIESGDVCVIAVADVCEAAGRIAHRFYAYPSRRLSLVGVTGTNGKTSVSHYVAHALQQVPRAGDKPLCGLLGTLGYGLYGALRAGVLTTPDTLSVHALLAEIADAGAEHAVMEVSSHGLAQGRVAAVEFNVGVFTNLSRDHLDFHADMHEYGEAKRQLFAVPTLSAAVVNADDEFGRELIRRMPETVQTFAYGLQFDPRELGEKVTPVCGRVVAAHRYSLTLEVNSSGVQAEFSAPLLGRFNALNLLAALGSLLACGVSLDVAAVALRNVPPVPGRMESFGGTDTEPLVVVDYSHTPDSLRTALGALREQSTGRLWCVFGCGGDRDTGKRAQMAAAAAELSDQIIITDDNPRTEDGDQIVADIVLGVPEQTEFQIVRDRLQAITQAVQSAAPRDTVLVAGKGHEPYQEINGLRRPFSDTASVRLALRGRHS